MYINVKLIEVKMEKIDPTLKDYFSSLPNDNLKELVVKTRRKLQGDLFDITNFMFSDSKRIERYLNECETVRDFYERIDRIEKIMIEEFESRGLVTA